MKACFIFVIFFQVFSAFAADYACMDSAIDLAHPFLSRSNQGGILQAGRTVSKGVSKSGKYNVRKFEVNFQYFAFNKITQRSVEVTFNEENGYCYPLSMVRTR